MVNASKRSQVYKCSLCGNIVSLLFVGGGELFCCGKSMDLLEEKTQDEGNEKHVPVIEKTIKGFKVKVGLVEHPMEQAHYIQWVELIADGKSYFEFLKPGMKPEAEFCVQAEKVLAREYCNLHGLWKKEL
ncbi:MAG: desulfoferrodoxin [archaeon]